MNEPMLIARGSRDLFLLPQMTNRHGLIAGATGTGKTVTLQTLAENFSRIGVPVFAPDVKGDLAGISQPGVLTPKLQTRVEQLRLDDWAPAAAPVTFWDLFGEQGHPIRTTITEMGPLLLSRMLNLNDTQSGLLTLLFRYADDNGLLLLDLKDLRALVQFAGEHARELRSEYGNVSPASIGAIQRNLLALEAEGGDKLFGEPALDLADFLQTDARGRGVINILAADRLMQNPRLYSSFLLWILAELFEDLPEVGDVAKPKMVFFFDEAHLLWDDISEALEEKIEQVARLVRSKGIGIYFVTQNPRDVPDTVLGQLGNRVQHALRAFTPADQKAVRAAAETFRSNPAFDVRTAIAELAVGEALISFLQPDGTPDVVERGFVLPPRSRIGSITAAERHAIIATSTVGTAYDQPADRDSAYERLKQRAASQPPESAVLQQAPENAPVTSPRPRIRTRESMGEAMVKSAARSIGSQIGRQVIRGILGSLFGSGRRR
jgi:DNA helicase HerA-like ATPase